MNIFHPSIKVIRKSASFSFDFINPECINNIMNDLDTSKATQQRDIPIKITKDKKDLFIFYFCKIRNKFTALFFL